MSPISKGNLITAADINALIDDVKTESTRRGDGWAGEPGDKSRGDKLDSTPSGAMYDQLVVINALHCSCEADGSTDSHNGGVPISLTAIDAVPLGKNQDRQMDDDIVSLAAQCSCDAFVCGCVAACTCFTACNCDSGNCSCQHLCSCDTNCTCDTDCTCDLFCQCDSYWYDVCGVHWMCFCDADWICSCNLHSGYYCECEDDCGCDTHCSCNNDCGCNPDCNCDKECDCEFGG